MSEQAFLDTLTVHPEDDTTRLVYADWLEERNDPRGRYLRLESELAGLSESDPRHAGIEQELSALLRTLPGDWVAVAGRRWDVWLTGYTPTLKIQVIKEIRELTGLGLLEAKNLSEALPARVVVNCSRCQAEWARERFVACTQHRWAGAPEPYVHLCLRPCPEPGALRDFPLPRMFELRLLGVRPRCKTALINALRRIYFHSVPTARRLIDRPLPVTLGRYASEEEARAVAADLESAAVVEVTRIAPAPPSAAIPRADMLPLGNQGRYRVRLLSYTGDRKVAVIMAIRQAIGVGLMEAKHIAEAPLPVVFVTGIPAAHAEAIRRSFAQLAEVDVQEDPTV